MNLEDMAGIAAEWVVELYGPFNPEVEITVHTDEDIRAPFTAFEDPDNWRKVNVVIPESDLDYATFQYLTHEIVHCLRPNGLPSGQATYLEEGLAEHSSAYFLDKHYPVTDENGNVIVSCWIDTYRSAKGKYSVAFNLVEKLIDAYGLDDFRSIIKNIRGTDMKLCDIDIKMLRKNFSKIEDQYLIELATPFHD